MEAKHTPGPWVIDWNVSRLDIFGADETTLVASLRRSFLSQAIDEAARSNARLIAAAPDLLDSLSEIFDYAGGADSALHDEYVMDRARAAIAKAEGK